MIGYLRLESLRALRDPRFLLLALLAPVGFYLLFAGLFGQGAGSEGLTQQVALMVSLGIYGAMFAVMLATGPRVAQDRAIGWQQQLRLLPVRGRSILVARLLAAMALAVPALVLVFVTASLTHGVTLSLGRWLALLALLWVTALPLAILGLAVGFATGAEVAFGVLYALTMVLSALGGLWMPMSFFPTGLQQVGKLLPTYQAADLGWRLVAGRPLDLAEALMLLGWTALFALLAAGLAARAPRGR